MFKSRVIVVQPTDRGTILPVLKEQDYLYTVILKGLVNKKRIIRKEIITCLSRGINPYSNWKDLLKTAVQPEIRFLISNTTEAGITYMQEPKPKNKCPSSFPAKVTAFLYERYCYFSGEKNKGMIILPCELIDRNGDQLKKIILQYSREWKLGKRFITWINQNNYFANTLVDRIVPGYPRDEIKIIQKELDYRDRLMVTGELFHLWVIQVNKKIIKELPFKKAGLNVVFTDNLAAYRTLKVSILNDLHTMTAL